MNSIYTFQALGIKGYLKAIESTLESLLCLKHFPSELTEKQEKPEVEMKDFD